jgi:hypothetical protein
MNYLDTIEYTPEELEMYGHHFLLGEICDLWFEHMAGECPNLLPLIQDLILIVVTNGDRTSATYCITSVLDTNPYDTTCLPLWKSE